MVCISTPKALTFTCLTYLTLTCSTTYAAEQVFVSLDEPCRLGDTRAISTPFTHESRQDFLAWSDGSPLTAQGGDNCELPRTGPKPSAIAANITAVSKFFHSKGNLLAYPFTGSNTLSDASLINFSDNNIANASVISLSPDASKHFSITGNIFNTTGAANSALTTHVVIDVTGYFYEATTDTVMNLKNVVTVSQQGAGFTDPIAAMATIIDAGPTNPYLLKIGPGDFILSQALEMKPYVTIKGAGMGQTILQGNAADEFTKDLESSVMIGADHATVTNLTLSNVQGDDLLIRRGIINKNVSPTIKDIKIEINTAQHCVGILNESTASPVIIHVDINATCDNTGYGIYNFLDATPIVSYSKISVLSNQASSSEGINNSSAHNVTTTIRHSTIEGSTAGVRSQGGGQATISFSTILGGTALGAAIIPNPDNDTTSVGSANLCGHSLNGDTSTKFSTQCL